MIIPAPERCGLRVEQGKEVVRYARNFHNDGLIVLLGADSCQQSCDDVGVKVSMDQANVCSQHLTAVTFETHVDGDTTVVGVAARR